MNWADWPASWKERPNVPSKVEKMRDSLLLAIDQVKSGALSPEKAKAMASLAHQVTASLDVELRVLLAAKLQPGAAAQLIAPAAEVESKELPTGTVHRGMGVTRHMMGDD